MPAWEWPDTLITRIIDGDTIDAMVTHEADIGFSGRSRTTFPVRLRLNRINAPKLATTAGKTTRDRVTAALSGLPVHVTTIKSYKYGPPEGREGEYMAEVRLPNGDNLSDLLVAEGLAVYWDGTGARPGES